MSDERSELEVALARIERDADELAPLLNPEIAPDAIAEDVQWKDGRAVACMSDRDGPILNVLERGQVERIFIGQLAGAVVSEKRDYVRNSVQGRALITKELRIEHPESDRLAEPLIFDVSQRQEERVDKIRNALLSLARN